MYVVFCPSRPPPPLMAVTDLTSLNVRMMNAVPMALMRTQANPYAAFCHVFSGRIGSRNTMFEWYRA